MKVPKYIKEAIVKSAKYNEKANSEERIIYKWLEKNKLTEDTCDCPIHSMEDYFIDCCQLTNRPSEFISNLEDINWL